MIFFFFFIDTATTEIYTLSLHDALPIFSSPAITWPTCPGGIGATRTDVPVKIGRAQSELQSPDHLVCRLLLEKKKKRVGVCGCDPAKVQDAFEVERLERLDDRGAEASGQ